MENVIIGRHAKIKKAIISEGVNIPHHTVIGFDPKKDMERFTVTPRGITVVTREDIPD
jgi:glucose-1-phosphate adenylyltransferase